MYQVSVQRVERYGEKKVWKITGGSWSQEELVQLTSSTTGSKWERGTSSEVYLISWFHVWTANVGGETSYEAHDLSCTEAPVQGNCGDMIIPFFFLLPIVFWVI